MKLLKNQPVKQELKVAIAAAAIWMARIREEDLKEGGLTT